MNICEKVDLRSHVGRFSIMNSWAVFFVVGIAGNFYHHYLLANLRRPTSKEQNEQKSYVAPHGGLFDYVAAPHYLFELIGWLGIAMVAHHGNAFMVFGGMSSYLSGRSVSQNRWNREKFDSKDSCFIYLS